MSRATQGTTTNKSYIRVQDFHLLWLNFPELFHFVDHQMLWPYNPTIAETTVVWAGPRSLATTRGIIIIFSSSGYLDVSVHRVCLLKRILCLQHSGLPHWEISGSKVICTYPKLIAAYHVLHRLREPRHSPYALTYFLTYIINI